MVIDCIPFFNELDILKLRLHILDPLVDRFVIEEATHTFSGLPKDLCFEKNREMFEEFLPKITYLVVDNSPRRSLHTNGINFRRMRWQRRLPMLQMRMSLF